MESKIVKVEVELTKGHVEAMEQFIAADTGGHKDQSLKEFIEYLLRMSWGDLAAKLGVDGKK